MVALIMFLILIGVFALAYSVDQLTPWSVDRRTRGSIALACMFAFAGVGHFIVPESLSHMLPEWVPARVALVYVSGTLELAGAIGLCIPRLRRTAGWCFIALLVLISPVNVYAVLGGGGLPEHEVGPIYLVYRMPLQVLFIWWAWYFAARAPQIPPSEPSQVPRP